MPNFYDDEFYRKTWLDRLLRAAWDVLAVFLVCVCICVLVLMFAILVLL